LSKKFDILVKTFNGEILEYPKVFSLPCDVYPVGYNIIRWFNQNYAIVVVKVFLLRNGLDVFGIEGITNIEQWLQLKDSLCQCCTEIECGIVYNGCLLQYNGCNLIYTK
jgi:hypothetical protein